MKTLVRSILATFAAMSLATGAFAAVTIGKPAPDFTLTDTNGTAHKLSDFKGKIVVLEWINLGCPYVKAQYDSRNMQTLQTTYTGKDVVWLSICSSAEGQQGHHSAGDWKKKIAEHGIAASAVLIDEPGTVGHLYGAKTTPHMYVINRDGVLAYNGAIDSSGSTRKDAILKAQNYVALAVDSLTAGKAVETATTRPFGCGIKYK
jgi:hypothetical protein